MFVGNWLKSIQAGWRGTKSPGSRRRVRGRRVASSIQQLEDRALLSSNSIHAFVQNGTLFIEGTGGHDSVLIQQGTAGTDSFSLTGQNGSTINGQTTAVAFDGIDRAIRINLGGGDDTVNFNGGAGATVVGDLFIVTGTGSDTVQISNVHVQGKTHILTLGGDDTLDVNANTFDGSVRAWTGRGRDTVLIDDSKFQSSVNVNTGAGKDQIDVERRAADTGTTTFSGPVTLRTGTGADRIQVGVAGQAGEKAVFSGPVLVHGGPGHDVLSFSTDNTVTSTVTLRSVHELTPPTITAGLAHDTAAGGTANTDGITSDPTIAGSLSNRDLVDSLTAVLDSNAPSTAVDILPQVKANGKFTLTPTQLQQINGGPLAQGAHTLHLTAKDQLGNIVASKDVAFTLDTTAPTPPTLNLDSASDSAPVGDNQTTNASVTLVGQTEANASVKLQPTGTVVTADGTGNFTFANVPLATGANAFTVTATDAAGNTSSATKTITRI